jgi:hypothetical protein
MATGFQTVYGLSKRAMSSRQIGRSESPDLLTIAIWNFDVFSIESQALTRPTLSRWICCARMSCTFGVVTRFFNRRCTQAFAVLQLTERSGVGPEWDLFQEASPVNAGAGEALADWFQGLEHQHQRFFFLSLDPFKPFALIRVIYFTNI